jgi:hypothetical protein
MVPTGPLAVPLAVGTCPADTFVVHFDFTEDDGRQVLSSTRKVSTRNLYDVRVPGARVDGRLAAAMAVALDALQSR